MFYKVLNRITYILVAVITVGGKPIPIKTGLKTMAPHDPKAPIRPATIDAIPIFARDQPE